MDFEIPFTSLDYEQDKEEHLLEIAHEKLQAAQDFDEDNWSTISDEKWNQDIYQHYGHQPYRE